MKVYAKAAQTPSVIREIQQQVASKQRSAVEVTSAYLARLRSVEGQVHSFLTVNEEQALEQVTRSTLIGSHWRQHAAAMTVMTMALVCRPRHWTSALHGKGQLQLGPWPECQLPSR